MSHRAMNWAIDQRQLKPAPWRVLVMLADRHNKDTLRVDPEQSLLAFDCNMSRSTVNRHLEDLEGAGLLVRVPRVNPRTKKQMPTFYILGLDFNAPPDVEFAVSDYRTRISQVQNGNKHLDRVSNSDTETVSQKSQKPCPKNKDSRVSKSDTNPVKEPVKEPCAPSDAPDDVSDLKGERGPIDRFLDAFPRVIDENKTRMAFLDLVNAGEDPEVLVRSAELYAAEQAGNEPKYIKTSDRFLKEGRWKLYVRNALGCSFDRDPSGWVASAQIHAGRIKRGDVLPGGISKALRKALIHFNHFTDEELRERGYP